MISSVKFNFCLVSLIIRVTIPFIISCFGNSLSDNMYEWKLESYFFFLLKLVTRLLFHKMNLSVEGIFKDMDIYLFYVSDCVLFLAQPL